MKSLKITVRNQKLCYQRATFSLHKYIGSTFVNKLIYSIYTRENTHLSNSTFLFLIIRPNTSNQLGDQLPRTIHLLWQCHCSKRDGNVRSGLLSWMLKNAFI